MLFRWFKRFVGFTCHCFNIMVEFYFIEKWTKKDQLYKLKEIHCVTWMQINSKSSYFISLCFYAMRKTKLNPGGFMQQHINTWIQQVQTEQDSCWKKRPAGLNKWRKRPTNVPEICRNWGCSHAFVCVKRIPVWVSEPGSDWLLTCILTMPCQDPKHRFRFLSHILPNGWPALASH